MDTSTPGGTCVVQLERLDQILTGFYHLFPNQLFERMSGLTTAEIRARKKVLCLTGRPMFLHHFSRTAELPDLSPLDNNEQEFVREYWATLRTDYATTQQAKNLRSLAKRFSNLIPASIIGLMYGTSGSAVLQHQRELGTQLTKPGARKLTNSFLRTKEPPRFRGLTADQQDRLDRAWREMRARTGVSKKQEEDQILSALNDKIATAVFAEMFGVSVDGISARRKALGLKAIAGDALLQVCLATEKAPEFSGLSAEQQRALQIAWHSVRIERTSKATGAKGRRTSTFVKKLLKRKAEVAKEGGKELVVCPNPQCQREWFRTSDFFYRSKNTTDGLEPRCKVCESLRRKRKSAPKRAKPRTLSALEREHICLLLKANRRAIPTQLLELLFGVKRNLLMILRREAGVKVTKFQSHELYRTWMWSEKMPQVFKLSALERERLEQLWLKEKRQFQLKIREDTGHLALQVKLKDQFAQRGTTLPLISCGGIYCKEKKLIWYKSPRFFRKYDRCDPEDRRCIACANYEKRLRKSKAIATSEDDKEVS